MRKDPILDEVHRSRAKLLKACGNDFEKLYKYIKAREAEHPERLAPPGLLARLRKRARIRLRRRTA